jgi:hypothetical protein
MRPARRPALLAASAVLGVLVGVPLVALGREGPHAGEAGGPPGRDAMIDATGKQPPPAVRAVVERDVLPPRIAGIDCADASRVEVAVPPDGIDEIRVVVANAAPGAATDVSVLGARSDRRVRAAGTGTWGVALTSPIAGDHLLIAVEPVLDASAGACVDRVELLSRGAVVAIARPR